MSIQLQQPLVSGVTPLRSLRDLPGPRGLPWLGNALQVDTTKLHLILEQWAQQYGPFYRIKLGPNVGIVIADPELNNQILRARPDTYRRTGTIEPVFQEIGAHGVFSAEGEEWRQQRKLATQALNARHLRNFFPTMTRVIERLQHRWQQAALQADAVDVQKDLMRLTVDVTTNLAFGYDMNTLEKEGDVIQQHLEQIFPAIGRRLNTPIPYWRYVKLPADRALDRALAEIHQTIHGFIAEARQRLAQQPELREQPTNFLEAMLALEELALEESAGAGEAVTTFSDEEIVGNVFTMLLGGEDTTASTLSWMLYYLALHPEIQTRMQDEADVVLGDNLLPTDLATLERLHLIEAVAHETMRLRPVSPIFGLEAQEDVVLTGVLIPKGTQVFLLIRPGMLTETNFGQAYEFEPDRWLAPTGCPFHGAHNRSVHVPFGNGPRLCPGRSLALLEIKAAMAMICRNFTVTPACDLNQVREVWGFTMMAAGLHLRFTPRAVTG